MVLEKNFHKVVVEGLEVKLMSYFVETHQLLNHNFFSMSTKLLPVVFIQVEKEVQQLVSQSMFLEILKQES